MTFYCTYCWGKVPESVATCPPCGDDIAARLTRADYADKLIAALHHSESTPPVRAAWILGERRERKAVGELRRLVRESADAFVIASAVEAPGKIGGEQVLEIACWTANHPSPVIRFTAQRALHQLSAKQDVKHGAVKG